MPTGPYARYEFDAALRRFKHRLIKSHSFEKMVKLYEWDRNAELRAFTQQELRYRLIVSVEMGFADIEAQCLKQRVFLSIFDRHELL